MTSAVQARHDTTQPGVLSPAQLVLLRAELEQLRAFRADQLLELSRPGGGPFGDPSCEVAQVVRAGARAAFFAVQHALWRIEEGTYGRCVGCDAVIPADELFAVPHASHCLPCRQAASPG